MKSDKLNTSALSINWVWPEKDANPYLPMSSSVIEFQIQIAALNKRLDQLTQTVQEIADPDQPDYVMQFFQP
jgi:hypothetical protein